ncbi:MAG TPA: protein kinase [Acidimicrobiales bacterium]|nr:protein kinase [Acidimicrobiales bacterium]
MAEPASTPAPIETVAPGVRIAARYRLVSRIAQGGMAEVWEAVDEVLTRPVAVKILLPHLAADKAFVTRFRREAIAAARLSDAHIVSIYDTCSVDDVEAIVMELVRGTTLRRFLDDQGVVHPRRAVDIAVQIAAALDHAHSNGLIHRDVKPGNILLSEDGRVLVTDFGIAKAAEAVSDLTEAGQVVGTAKYLSPEQVQGAALDARSDVYALGVVLYEMLCGRPPFAGDNATSTAVARLTSEPLRPRQVRAGLPRQLEDIVLRAMARHPDDRYASAAELRAALVAVDLSRVEPDDDDTRLPEATAMAAHEPGEWRRPPPPSAPPPPAPPRFAQTERAWLVPAALIVVVAITLAVVGVLLGRTGVGRDFFGAVRGATPGGSPAEPLPIAAASSFDPQGDDGRESDSELPLLVDPDPASAWTTVRYNSRDLGGLKEGVGVILELQAPSELASLAVDSPTRDWAAEVYVADEAAPDLSGWGPPVASAQNIDGDARFDLDGRRGRAVLVWITDLGDGSVGPRFSTAIGNVELKGR